MTDKRKNNKIFITEIFYCEEIDVDKKIIPKLLVNLTVYNAQYDMPH